MSSLVQTYGGPRTLPIRGIIPERLGESPDIRVLVVNVLCESASASPDVGSIHERGFLVVGQLERFHLGRRWEQAESGLEPRSTRDQGHEYRTPHLDDGL